MINIAASSGTNIAPLLLSAIAIGLLFFFMIVRPQKRSLANHKAMVAALAPGDDIITSGGIYGKIKSVGPESVQLEIADGLEIQVAIRSLAMKKAVEQDENKLASSDS